MAQCYFSARPSFDVAFWRVRHLLWSAVALPPPRLTRHRGEVRLAHWSIVRHNLSGADVCGGVSKREVSQTEQILLVCFQKPDLEAQFTRLYGNGSRLVLCGVSSSQQRSGFRRKLVARCPGSHGTSGSRRLAFTMGTSRPSSHRVQFTKPIGASLDLDAKIAASNLGQDNIVA